MLLLFFFFRLTLFAPHRYVGEVMTPRAYAELVATKYKGREHFHCMTLDSGLVVDGGSFGGEARWAVSFLRLLLHARARTHTHVFTHAHTYTHTHIRTQSHAPTHAHAHAHHVRKV